MSLNQVFLSLSRFLAMLPGIAYLADFTHKVQKNPPREISMIMSLKGPSECVMVMKLPEVSYTFFRQLGFFLLLFKKQSVLHLLVHSNQLWWDSENCCSIAM